MPRNACLIVVEDDPDLRGDLVDYLNLRGFTALGAATAGHLFDLLAVRKATLVLLDVGLPDQSGLEVIPKLRLHHPEVGIVMLTAYGDAQTRVSSLDSGADAYLVKGASLEVIEATCMALLRRLEHAHTLPSAATQAAEGPSTDPVPWAAATEGSTQAQPVWRLDTLTGQLRAPQGEMLQLTLMERNFLAQLMEQPGQIVTRQEILAALGRSETLSNLRNLDGCAARLRRKVEQELGQALPVRSSYGQGYAFTSWSQVLP
jgi:two-component system, OmpR family, response regulator